MGAVGSEAIQDMHASAGYSMLGTDKPMSLPPKSMSLATFHEFHEKFLAHTPFHATWRKNISVSNNVSPRSGQCCAYSYTLNKLFFAFGEGPNNTLLTDLCVFDPATFKFKQVIPELGEGRVNASALIVDNYLYIFGGNSGDHYFNDFIRYNILTNEVINIKMNDHRGPSPRSSAVMAHYNKRFYIWGGNNAVSEVDSDIHVYDIASNQWVRIPTKFEPLPEPGYTQQDQYCYMFGSSSKYNMLRLDMKNFIIEQMKPSGATPQTTVRHPTLIACKDFILCFGGSDNYLYSHLFAYDVAKNWWFVFHIKPVRDSKKIGEITNSGLFKVPRQDSHSAFYDYNNRIIYYMFGNRLEQDNPVYEFRIGKALAILNEEDDMSRMLFYNH